LEDFFSFPPLFLAAFSFFSAGEFSPVFPPCFSPRLTKKNIKKMGGFPAPKNLPVHPLPFFLVLALHFFFEEQTFFWEHFLHLEPQSHMWAGWVYSFFFSFYPEFLHIMRSSLIPLFDIGNVPGREICVDQRSETWGRMRADFPYLTGSQWSEACYVGYGSRSALWKAKCLGEKPQFNEFQRAIMQVGVDEEPMARERFSQHTGRQTYLTGAWRRGWVQSSPDAFVINDLAGVSYHYCAEQREYLIECAPGALTPVEIKVPSAKSGIQDKVPPNERLLAYFIQGTAHAMATNACDFYVFISSTDYRTDPDNNRGAICYHAQRCPRLEEIIIGCLEDFYKYVESSVPPPPRNRNNPQVQALESYLCDWGKSYAEALSSLKS